MPLQHAYAVTNLAALGFTTWSNGAATNASYLRDGRMDRIFSVGAVASGVNVVIDLGSAVSVSALAILNSNIASAVAPTITIRAADDSGMSVNLVTPKAATTPNTTAPRNKDHVLQFVAATKRYWQIVYTWTGTFTLTVGEIFVAKPTALTRYVVFGHAEDEEYVTTEFQSEAGETRGHFVSGPLRAKTLPFEDLAEAERDEVLAMRRAAKAGALPLIWCHQYEAVSTAAAAAYQDVIYGRLRDMRSFNWKEFDYGRHAMPPLILKSLSRELGA